MEASVPPGGGPPPHIHSREDETATPITLLMNWVPLRRSGDQGWPNRKCRMIPWLRSVDLIERNQPWQHPLRRR
jgi:hypothetical protein